MYGREDWKINGWLEGRWRWWSWRFLGNSSSSCCYDFYFVSLLLRLLLFVRIAWRLACLFLSTRKKIFGNDVEYSGLVISAEDFLLPRYSCFLHILAEQSMLLSLPLPPNPPCFFFLLLHRLRPDSKMSTCVSSLSFSPRPPPLSFSSTDFAQIQKCLLACLRENAKESVSAGAGIFTGVAASAPVHITSPEASGTLVAELRQSFARV
jgi:hypothetical protein